MIQATEMDGVYITPLNIYEDERGKVMKMMRKGQLIGGSGRVFREVKEIYFSTIVAGVVKGWHGHKVMKLNYACVYGNVLIGLCDLRVGKTFRETAQVHLDDDKNYHLLTIPPGVWNGIKSYSDLSIIANAATETYGDWEIERVNPIEFPIPFDWGEYRIAG